MSWLDQLNVFYFMLFLTYDGFVRACNSMSIYTVLGICIFKVFVFHLPISIVFLLVIYGRCT